MKSRIVFAVFVVAPFLHPGVSRGGWHTDGLPVATIAGEQQAVVATTDGSGGAIVAFTNFVGGVGFHVYAQRVGPTGTRMWTNPGVSLSTATGNQGGTALLADGASGIFAVWVETRPGTGADIYAQRLNSSGVPQWLADGVPICSVAGEQTVPHIAKDGAGGAIVSWMDRRGGATYDLYAQRVNAAGVVQWAAGGVSICTATNNQFSPVLTPDGLSGAVVAWSDNRSGGLNYGIYAQRVNAAGAVQWTADGVELATSAGNQIPQIVSDGAAGAIVTWSDYANTYVQRITSVGTLSWIATGVVLSATAGLSSPVIVADGAGGAIVSWADTRDGSSHIYGQRINSAGSVQWLSPTAIGGTTAPGGQSDPQLVTDGAGGAIVTWADLRNGVDTDIYSQRVNASGAVQWTAGGVPMCTATNTQDYPVIAIDGAAGAFVVWNDNRSLSYRVYAQRVVASGLITTAVSTRIPASPVSVGNNYPNPFSAHTSVDVVLGHDSAVTIEVFDVAGRRVRSLDAGRLEAGASQLTFDAFDDRGHALPSGVYFYRVHANDATVTRKILIAR